MKIKNILLVMAMVFLISGCVVRERIIDLRENSTSLRGEIRAGQSLDPDWNVDVWIGSTGRSGRLPSFVLRPQGSAEWEASDYNNSFFVYAEAWTRHNGRKIIMARTRSPERVTVSRYADRSGYGWSVVIGMYEDGDLYTYQQPIPKRMDVYEPQWSW